jgi:hypothetical protein
MKSSLQANSISIDYFEPIHLSWFWPMPDIQTHFSCRQVIRCDLYSATLRTGFPLLSFTQKKSQ